jgi:hypothetical protein
MLPELAVAETEQGEELFDTVVEGISKLTAESIENVKAGTGNLLRSHMTHVEVLR